jgi:hypothetical protein
MPFYLYHAVPQPMAGEVLMPLNQLKLAQPAIYQAQVAKYNDGRQALLKQKIPILNCLWNDVIHLSPVAPAKTRRALLAAGVSRQHSWPMYKINLELIDQSRAVLYKSQPGLGINPDSVWPLSPRVLKQHQEVPPDTLAYYAEEAKADPTGDSIFTNYLMPHVLYQGSIDVSSPLVKVVKA